MTSQSFSFQNVTDICAADLHHPPSSKHPPVAEVFLRLAAEGLELQMAGSCPVRNFPHKMAGPAPARQRPAANTMTNVQSLLHKYTEHNARCERSGHFTLHLLQKSETCWRRLLFICHWVPTKNRCMESTGKLGGNCSCGYLNKLNTGWFDCCRLCIYCHEHENEGRGETLASFLFSTSSLWIFSNKYLLKSTIIWKNVLPLIISCSVGVFSCFPVIFNFWISTFPLFLSVWRDNLCVPSSHGGCLRPDPNRWRR